MQRVSRRRPQYCFATDVTDHNHSVRSDKRKMSRAAYLAKQMILAEMSRHQEGPSARMSLQTSRVGLTHVSWARSTDVTPASSVFLNFLLKLQWLIIDYGQYLILADVTKIRPSPWWPCSSRCHDQIIGSEDVPLAKCHAAEPLRWSTFTKRCHGADRTLRQSGSPNVTPLTFSIRSISRKRRHIGACLGPLQPPGKYHRQYDLCLPSGDLHGRGWIETSSRYHPRP